jgi:hypothetical protein
MNKFFMGILIFSQIVLAKGDLPSRRPSFPCEKAKTKIETAREALKANLLKIKNEKNYNKA